MSPSVVQDLRQPAPRGLGVPPSISLDPASLRARARDLKVPPRRRDEALLALLRRYRSGNQRLWGPLLLDLLAPAIVSRLQRLRPVLPAIDEEDLTQELVLQVLIVAATMPIPEEPAFLERELMLAAKKRVARWLASEARRQESQLPLEVLDNGRA